jgi:hypothetical protein
MILQVVRTSAQRKSSHFPTVLKANANLFKKKSIILKVLINLYTQTGLSWTAFARAKSGRSKP